MKQVVRSISVFELHRRFAEAEKTALIDVRTPAEFAAAHVPGAQNAPVGTPELEAYVRKNCEADTPVFVICQSGGRSRLGCEKLAATGWDVTSVDGGTAAWAEAGYPIERAPGARNVISIERQVRIVAGLLVAAGCGLGWTVHSGFFAIAAIVGAGLMFAGITDFCRMGLLLARMPWNRA